MVGIILIGYLVIAAIILALLLFAEFSGNKGKKDKYLSIIFALGFSLFWCISIPFLVYESWKDYKDEYGE